MIKLAFIFSSLLAVSSTTITNENLDNNMSECEYLTLEENHLKMSLFANDFNECPTDIDWNAIELVEIEDDVEIGFNTKDYLPEGFNPLKGLHDLDWSTIKLVEIEEEVEIGFNTKDYLPADFNPLKGMHDLDWTQIELIELDEDVQISFNTKDYLPANFNPYVGMCTI